MPEGYKGWQSREDTLTDDQIVRVARVAAGLGFRKFRVTGGEPLVRASVVEILQRIWEIPGVETLGLSTNGIMLDRLAVPLRQAGVRTINVSLDALDPAIYRRVTGGDVAKVLAGIEAALDASAAAGAAVGLGTGNLRDGARLKLSRVGLHERFAFGGFGCDDEARPALLRVGAERGAQALGAPLGACRVVVIGDTPRDVAAAQAIGAECIAVATGSFSTEALRACSPSWVFRDLAAEGAIPALLGAPP